MTWPKIGYETLPWFTAGQMSNRARSKAPVTYDSALVPHIAHCHVDLPRELHNRINEVTEKLALFDDRLARKKHHRLLSYVEAIASSRIEGIVASPRKVFESELTGTYFGNAGLVAAHQRQIDSAIRGTVKVDFRHDDLRYLHRILMEGSASAVAGKLREDPVWIGGSDSYPVEADYVAPHPRHVAALICDFLAFLRRTDIPPLPHAAIAHAQFEKIHPFADGNGRTGRTLVHIVINQRGVTRSLVAPISIALVHNQDEYFGALDSYAEGDIIPIIELFADAVEDAIQAVRCGFLVPVFRRPGTAGFRVVGTGG
ncbi:Fic family protein, partial [Corynebacterium aquatimens]